MRGIGYHDIVYFRKLMHLDVLPHYSSMHRIIIRGHRKVNHAYEYIVWYGWQNKKEKTKSKKG